MVKSLLAFAGCIFAVTGVLKLFAAIGEQQFLTLSDPIFSFASIQVTFFVASFLELGTVVFLVSKAEQKAKLGAVVWLCSIFAVYRIGLWAIGYQGPCRCLGGEWAILGISPEHWERLVAVVLYLMVALSWTLLLHRIWTRKYRTASPIT